MNYRHAFHAGNFADVFKHIVLTRILLYLMRKPAPLRYLDTHAGLGRYDLAASEAARTGEWRDGVARILRASPPPEIADLIQPWRTALGPLSEDASLQSYPGSPLLAANLLRPQDRLTLCELHPMDHAKLAATIYRDRRAKALNIDGYMALKAYVPPVERRGLVLVDPPFESRSEFAAMAKAVIAAWRKWPGGCYCLWYPVKDMQAVEDFHASLHEAGVGNILRAELAVAAVEVAGPLSACGLAVINPPYVLPDELAVLGPWLANELAQRPGGFFHQDLIAPQG